MRAVKNLLVLYTGGTIGMLETPQGLAPAGGFDVRMREHLAQLDDAPQIQWTLREMNPLLDSANMQQANWLAMRDAIVEAVERDGHDGVLVLHGTDTLAYTGAALSFVLLGLPVPVLLTGSMLPAGAPDSDAWDNLIGALRLLESGIEDGVQLYFHEQLLHGCRVQGLVLECYGSGTGPSDDQALLDVLHDAHQGGVVIVAISQCPVGSVVFDTYAAGSRLRDTGLISGGGMTREAALGKLVGWLGAGLDAQATEHWFALDLCGERA